MWNSKKNIVRVSIQATYLSEYILSYMFSTILGTNLHITELPHLSSKLGMSGIFLGTEPNQCGGACAYANKFSHSPSKLAAHKELPKMCQLQKECSEVLESALLGTGHHCVSQHLNLLRRSTGISRL